MKKIAYVPYSSDFTKPGDRRRFCHYASQKNLLFEIYEEDKEYDLVILTQLADISFWKDYNKNSKTKIIFDFTDSYLKDSLDIKGLLRGTAKFFSGQNKKFVPNYRKALKEMCRRADAVICTTIEQKEMIREYNNNVHMILDYQNFVVNKVKEDYRVSDTFHIVWEGLPNNVDFLLELKQPLKKLAGKYPIALHVVTDPIYYRHMNKYGKTNTAEKIRDYYESIHLQQWNEKTLSDIITGCDLAVLPVPLDNPFNSGRPENKLLLFWRMGMPVLASSIPSYRRTMSLAGQEGFLCYDEKDWAGKIEEMILDEKKRRDSALAGKSFAENNYSEEKITEKWDILFSSLE